MKGPGRSGSPRRRPLGPSACNPAAVPGPSPGSCSPCAHRPCWAGAGRATRCVRSDSGTRSPALPHLQGSPPRAHLLLLDSITGIAPLSGSATGPPDCDISQISALFRLASSGREKHPCSTSRSASPARSSTRLASSLPTTRRPPCGRRPYRSTVRRNGSTYVPTRHVEVGTRLQLTDTPPLLPEGGVTTTTGRARGRRTCGVQEGDSTKSCEARRILTRAGTRCTTRSATKVPQPVQTQSPPGSPFLR